MTRPLQPGPSEPRSDPHKVLMAAVLEQAVKDLRIINLGPQRTAGGPEAFHRAVVEWVGTEDFKRVCELAEVDPIACEQMMDREIRSAQEECEWLQRYLPIGRT